MDNNKDDSDLVRKPHDLAAERELEDLQVAMRDDGELHGRVETLVSAQIKMQHEAKLGGNAKRRKNLSTTELLLIIQNQIKLLEAEINWFQNQIDQLNEDNERLREDLRLINEGLGRIRLIAPDSEEAKTICDKFGVENLYELESKAGDIEDTLDRNTETITDYELEIQRRREKSQQLKGDLENADPELLWTIAKEGVANEELENRAAELNTDRFAIEQMALSSFGSFASSLDDDNDVSKIKGSFNLAATSEDIGGLEEELRPEVNTSPTIRLG